MWVDVTQPVQEIVIRDGISRVVADLLPGVRLLEMVKNPF